MPLQFGMYQNQVKPDIRGGLDAFKSGLQIAGALGDIRASRQQRQEMQALKALMADPANFDQATGQLNYQKLLPEVAKTAPGQFQSFSKLASEQQSAGLQAKKQQLDMLMTATKFKRDSMMRVMTNPTVQNANQVLDEWSRLTSDDSSDEKAAVAGMTPDQIKRWAVGHAAEARDMEKLMPQFKLESFGGFRQAVGVDPMTGQPITAGEQMPMTATPGEQMTDARTRAQQAEQRRQFGITEARLARTGGADKQKLIETTTGFEWVSPGEMPLGAPIPKQGRDQGSIKKEQKIQDAKDVLMLLDEAEPLLKKATGSYLGAGFDIAGKAIGVDRQATRSADQLKIIEGMLIMKMPRMEGPQSNLDVQLYRQMAGNIGDPTVSAARKKAAMEQIRKINQKYVSQQQERPAQQQPSGNMPRPDQSKSGWQAAGYSSASDAYRDFKSARDRAFKAGNYDLVRQIEAEARSDGVIK